jgi:superfamily II DNA or RNA helicase
MTIKGQSSLLRTLSEVLGRPSDADQQYNIALRELRPARWKVAPEDEDERSDVPAVEHVRRESAVSLFDFQADLVEQISNLVGSGRKSQAGLVSLPTGAGKTRTACTACLRLLGSGRVHRILWVAPTAELLEQAISAFKLISQLGEGPDSFALVRSVSTTALADPGEPAVFFGTCQLLASRVKRDSKELPVTDLLVFDEAHYALAPSYLLAVSQLRRSGVALLGLTATPGRRGEEQSEKLADLFNNRWLISQCLGPRPIERLRERGILSEVVFRQIVFDGAGPGTVLSRRYPRTLPIDQLCAHPGRFAATLEALIGLPANDKAIVFAGSLEHAAALAAALRARGVKVGLVSGYQDPANRKRALEAFEHGQTTIMLNKSVLIAGYDCPATKHVFLTIPVNSPITFEQMVGRASRGPLVGGNSESYIWQLDDMLKLHGKPSSYTRYLGHSWFGMPGTG